jgi:hypothetical protein
LFGNECSGHEISLLASCDKFLFGASGCCVGAARWNASRAWRFSRSRQRRKADKSHPAAAHWLTGERGSNRRGPGRHRRRQTAPGFGHGLFERLQTLCYPVVTALRLFADTGTSVKYFSTRKLFNG